MHQIVGFATFSPKCNHPGKNATGFLKSETGLSGNVYWSSILNKIIKIEEYCSITF